MDKNKAKDKGTLADKPARTYFNVLKDSILNLYRKFNHKKNQQNINREKNRFHTMNKEEKDIEVKKNEKLKINILILLKFSNFQEEGSDINNLLSFLRKDNNLFEINLIVFSNNKFTAPIRLEEERIDENLFFDISKRLGQSKNFSNFEEILNYGAKFLKEKKKTLQGIPSKGMDYVFIMEGDLLNSFEDIPSILTRKEIENQRLVLMSKWGNKGKIFSSEFSSLPSLLHDAPNFKKYISNFERIKIHPEFTEITTSNFIEKSTSLKIEGFSCSVSGCRHIKNKTPCQDASFVGKVDNKYIIMVCDGAGSKKFSDLGSKKAIEVLKDCIYKYKKSISKCLDNDDSINLNNLAEWEDLSKKIIDDLANSQNYLAKTLEEDPALFEYTISCFIIGEKKIAAIKVGDSPAFKYTNDKISAIFKEDSTKQEFANISFFVSYNKKTFPMNSTLIERSDKMSLICYSDGVEPLLGSEENIKNYFYEILKDINKGKYTKKDMEKELLSSEWKELGLGDDKSFAIISIETK